MIQQRPRLLMIQQTETEASQNLHEPEPETEPFPTEDLPGSSSEEEVSDFIDEFTSSNAEPTPHHRKRSAVKVSSVHKKSRTDENPLNFLPSKPLHSTFGALILIN